MKIHSYPFWNVRHGLLELEHSGIFGYSGHDLEFLWQDCQDARVHFSKLAPKIAVLGVTHSKDLQHRLPPSELTATLNEPRNLGANFDRNVHFHHVTCLGPLGGVALDLIGVYLKNYEIDKWPACKAVQSERFWKWHVKSGPRWILGGSAHSDPLVHRKVCASFSSWIILHVPVHNFQVWLCPWTGSPLVMLLETVLDVCNAQCLQI